MAHTRQELRQRNKQARHRLWWRRAVALLILLLILSIVAILFLRLDRWQLGAIVVRGNQAAGVGELSQAVDKLLAGNYGQVLPRRQRWFYPEREIRETLLQQFPRLNSVATYVEQGALVLLVKEHGPAAIWCLVDRSKCYFINQQAQVFSLAPEFSRPIYLTIVKANAEPSIPGTAPFSAADLDYILNWRDAAQKLFNQYWPEPVNIFLVTGAEGDDYRLSIAPASSPDSNFQVLINLQQDSSLLFRTLESLLQSKSLGDLGDRALPLDYLDLRFAPKVFYRFAG